MAVAQEREHFNCATCTRRHCDETGELEGSIGPAGFAMWEVDGVGEFRTCLLPRVTPWARRMLSLHMDWKNQLLPWAGGTLEQPAAYADIMHTIENALNDHG